jgi:hypothetical protein
LFIVVLGVSATRAPLVSGHVGATDVTYLKDVAPIIEKRCAACHASGGVARLPLDSYQRAREQARQIREAVLERRMPPWPAAPGFGDFRNDRSLPATEIAVLSAWAAGGTPLGAGAPVPPAPVPSAPAGEVVIVALPDGYSAHGAERQPLQLTCGANRITQAVRAVGITPYAAEGESVEIMARYPDGTTEPLCVVPRYRSDYALTYEFRTPMRLERGTVVEVRSSTRGCSAVLDVIAQPSRRADARGR